MASTARSSTVRLVHLPHFAIPLGLAGLGGAWTAGVLVLHAPKWVDDTLYTVAGVLWLLFSAVYIGERARHRGAFRSDRESAASGAGAAFLPVVGILLIVHFGRYMPLAAARTVCWILVAALAVVAAQLLAHWLTGQLTFQQLHPGYTLPLVAGPFIAAIGLASVQAVSAARAALGVGMFFWVVIGGVITARLITGGPLPERVLPSLSVLLAPPATGGIATFVAYPGPIGPLQLAFFGVFVVMALVQIALLKAYLCLPFSLGFWNFTFPVSASANYSLRWLGESEFDGRDGLAWGVLGLATLFVLSIAVATVRGLTPAVRRRLGRRG
ncbi:TDT family transporter [Streptomyces sp. NPDC019645]|uniref:SLAC1 family transporter n=1 Tax=unclassified Streptomyces TaxID=2593676 RepID=UPI00340958CF